ncbi:MAG: Trk system potassium transporter TrkA [Ignavibacteriales bacterium]|nr:Trk system potassium transporter TrkA [Ignavibacteriales bacterium]MCB9211732.1 Trk system potassium transporter TrkA [Ignavibacteriales bacterium]MCB9258624.1 Trk system potassium transporter TrkA [Ignavibacteriales bacterium]
MNIIIAGAGEVGYHLAKQLSNENHDITVIDVNGNSLERVDSVMDVLTITGSSTSLEILKKANCEKTDLLVAVTSSEAVNVNTAIIAKKLGAKKTIARVENGEYISKENAELFRLVGIDHLIYPEELAAQELVKLIQRAAATDIIEFEDGKLSLIGLKLENNLPVVRKTIQEIAQSFDQITFRVVAIHRGIRTIVPSGSDILLPNDQIFVITTHQGIEQIIKLVGKDQAKLHNIMFLGGGKIGRIAAKILESTINIKLIDSDKNKALELADYLEKTLVIQGDGRDIDLLAQEGIIDMDGFIAVTQDAETNIITSLMAKHLGVTKTIALVDNVDYIPLTQTIGLDSLINKKLIAANNILKFIRKANIISIATLQGIDAEVLEYVAQPNSTITKKKVKDLKFPQNAIIGGYIRGEESFISVGESQIEANDRVVVFSLPGTIHKVEKFFQ